jgi:hypothetical protein
MILSFMRNKVVEVEPLAGGDLAVQWRLTDSLLDAEVRIRVRLPDLEIAEAEASVSRHPHGECVRAPELMRKAVGVRVGPGLRKIVDGLLGGADGCPELAEGILESCNAVVLHFTVPPLRMNEGGTDEERRERLQAMVRFNPRLVRSCVAFADDSPLMEGLDLSK